MNNNKYKRKRVIFKFIFVFSLLACFFVFSVHSFADSSIRYANNGSSAYQFTPVLHANAFLQGYNTYEQSSSLLVRNAVTFDDMFASAFAPSQDAYATIYYHYTTPTVSRENSIRQLQANERVGLSLFNYYGEFTYQSRLYYDSSSSSGEWFSLPKFTYPAQFVRLSDWDFSVARPMTITFDFAQNAGYDSSWKYSLEVLVPNSELGKPFEWVSVPLGNLTNFIWRSSADPSQAGTYKTAYTLPLRTSLQSDASNNAWDVLSSSARNGVVCIRGSLSCSASDGSIYRLRSFSASSYGSTSQNWSEYFSRWYMNDSIQLVEVPIGTDWLNWIIKSASAFLDTPLFGSFSIGSLLLVVLGIAIFNLFVHMFRG